MKRTIVALSLLAAVDCFANTFAVTDAVPATATQPDAFKCTFNPLGGGAALVKSFAPTKAADGTVHLEADLTAALPAGVYVNSFCVATKTGYSDSPSSNVVTQFILGTLSAPSGFVIIVK